MTLKQRRRRFHRRKVAVILDATLASGRNSLRGIGQYVREHGPWSIYLETHGLEARRAKCLQGWEGDGIIARVSNRRIAAAIKQTGLPVVDVLGLVPEAKFPLLHVDNAACSRLAAEHLLELGLRRFGFCGLQDVYWSHIRRDAFQQAIRDAGCECDVFHVPREIRGARSWEKVGGRLTRWVRDLPKPIGVMACNDPTALLVLESCRQGGVVVPEEVAVIGVDDDEALCMVADPPLSSVTTNHDHVGYEAASLLERLMSGHRPPKSSTLVAPRGVATRASTDVSAIGDPEMVSIMKFIREHACDGLNLNDVVEFSGLSRSTLMRKSRSVLGRTLYEEITRLRLKHVRQLLAEANLSIEAVSHISGFKHRQYLGKVFKAQCGETLAQYRNRFRR